MPLGFIKFLGKREFFRSDFIPFAFLLAFVTAWLIVLYDATTKYLGGIGLVTLGAIRAIHCLIGNPKSPVLFLSMILLTHVIVVSAIAYRLENKRPRLRWRDVWIVVIGVVAGNGLALAYMHWRGALVPANMHLLIGPVIAGGVYSLWATWLLVSKKISSRQKGERLMLMGLFWLFVYDASILLSNQQYLASLSISILLICAMMSFFTIRWLSRRAQFGRVGYRSEHPINHPQGQKIS
jgi:hypothetical protein